MVSGRGRTLKGLLKLRVGVEENVGVPNTGRVVAGFADLVFLRVKRAGKFSPAILDGDLPITASTFEDAFRREKIQMERARPL